MAALLGGAVHGAVQAGQIHGDEGAIILAAWSLVHGLTQLIMGDKLRGANSQPLSWPMR